jgi:Peptidase M50B-like
MSSTQVPLSGTEATVIGLVALAAVSFDFGWRIVRHTGTMAHEGAHAVVGSLLFLNVRGIVINSDATGATTMNRGGCLSGVLAGFAGYVGPSLFGLGAAWLIESGHIVTVLWITLFLLGVLLVGTRWSFGMISVIVAGGLVYLIGRYAPASGQIIAAYAIAWLLLLTGVRQILQYGVNAGDAGILSGRTGIPRLLWFLLWLAATVAAVAVGGKMLVMPT